MNIKIFPLFFLLFLTSCVTTGNEWIPEVISVNEATINKLKDNLTAGEYGRVIQDTDTLKREFPELVGDEVLELEEQAFLLLKENYNKALDSGTWADALTYHKELSVVLANLEAYSAFSPDSDSIVWTEGEILRKQAETLIEDLPVPALIIFQKSLAYDIPAEEELLRYGELALVEQSREGLKQIVAIMRLKGMEAPASFTDYLAVEGTPLDFMKGTVTIWVNRGIKVESGMGYADRVIGSGFFIDKRGYLITNHHVIESEVDPEYSGYSRLYIRLPGEQGDKIPAEVIGWDPVFDIALLKTVMEPEYIYSFKNVEEYVPGDKIYAIGSPGGLENTITSGIISATGRRLLEVGDTIQVDVPINSGNSGGPLLNESGELIGVVFAGIEQFEGVNFAIPSEWVSGRIPSFYEGGRQEIPWIGASLYEGNKGMEVLYTYPASPSERGGIKPGDMLLSVNGTVVKSLGEAQKVIMSLDGQRLAAFHWKRGEEEFTSLLNLDERPDMPLENSLEIDSMERLVLPLFGMEIEPTGRKNYVIKKVYPGMSAEETGLSENDPLTVYEWRYEEEYNVVLLQIRIKKRKAGFMESVVQLAAYVNLSNLI
ncbi:MAG: trypsin-like peptidase domain-containing protein [Spirochaetales bacterium]|nr:trypsin-like peptidase domain-containing protein [Spirochaetales bacterium]